MDISDGNLNLTDAGVDPALQQKAQARKSLSPLPKNATTIVGGLDAWKDAWVELLRDKGASHAVTFAFNQPVTLEMARERFGKFLQYLDRKFLGPQYSRKIDERTFAIAIAENISSNIHLHAIFALDDKYHGSFSDIANTIWADLFPAGDLKIEPIYDLKGAVAYMTKHARNQNVFDSQILSSEFHRLAND